MNDQTLAADLHIAVMRLARRMRAEREEGLTSTQISTLASLVRTGAQPISALAAHERVKAPSMTRTVSTLESAGLVTRGPSADDARLVMVRATPAGEQVIGRIRQARRDWLGQQLAELPAD